MSPCRGNTSHFRSYSSDPLGLFELTRRLSRALDLPHALRPKLQRYKDTIRCGALSAEISGHRQQQLTQTLIVLLLKTHFFTFLKSQQNIIELVSRPDTPKPP